jgi:hypothetical protein
MKEAVHCNTLEEWNHITSTADMLGFDNKFGTMQHDADYKDSYCLSPSENQWSHKGYYVDHGYEILTCDEWCVRHKYQTLYKLNNNGMEKQMLDVLNKTYDNPILRNTTVPLFMSNPGIGKSSIARQFAKAKGVKMTKITLSQRMPNEVVGMVVPDEKTNRLKVYDSHELSLLKDGDILFLDEVFNGTLKQTLDAALNLLEDRTLPSGTRLADIMIIAASNPQGLINLTPQIKERFIKYELKFDVEEYQVLLMGKYGMPKKISKNLCTLIQKEKFESAWDYVTPRSIEKAINQIGCELENPYSDILLPYLSENIESPMDVAAINVKKGEQVSYLELLKLIVKNDNKNYKQKSRAAADLPSGE